MLIGYARVSTQDQTPALQLDALKAAGCEPIFVEKASGVQGDRPELKAADYVRENAGDVLVVWKLDRLARSLSQLIDTADQLERRGIGFRSLTEAIDTTSAGGRLVFHVFGAMTEFERSIIRERTKAGLDAARARGRTGGSPFPIGQRRRSGQGNADRSGHYRERGGPTAEGGAIDALSASSGRSRRVAGAQLRRAAEDARTPTG